MPQVPLAAYFTYGSAYMSTYSPGSRPVLHARTSILYVCISIPALQRAHPYLSVIQNEVSQKEKNRYHTLTHIHGIKKLFFFLLELNEKPLLANPVHPSLTMLQGGVFFNIILFILIGG